jgi:uncharacterized protein (DUF305 family)
MGMSADGMARHFIEEMIPHHEDAVVMADLALAQAEHAELRFLASEIRRVQTEEILLMRQWYLDWFGSEPSASGMGGPGHGIAGGAGHQMPMGQSMMGVSMGMGHQMGQGMSHGMAGHDPMAIDGAVPFDKAFIEDMIPHHEMAVIMSTMALRRVDRPELQALLRSIVESQSAEIALMRGWYEAWYGLPVPATSAHGAPMPAIRGLSPGEAHAIGAGEGAGMARAAELNGIPGPRHVLDLAEQLGLTPGQHAEITAIHATMHEEAIRVGQAYLDAQHAFEQQLRDPARRGQALTTQHPEVTTLHGELQRTHLRAHVATASVLSEEQIATYNTLRGHHPAD